MGKHVTAVDELGHGTREKRIGTMGKPKSAIRTIFLMLAALIILFVDLLYAFIDPRIRAKYAKARV